MALFDIFKIGGAQRKAAEAQAQAQRVAGLFAKRAQKPLPKPAAIGPAVPQTPTYSQGGFSPQIEALQRGLGGLESLTSLQKTPLAPVPAPQTPSEDALKPIETDILAGQAKTPEETDLEQRLANFFASREKGLVEAEQRVIPLNFIRGMQEAIEKRGAAAAVPLQTQFAQLQARRAGTLEAAKTRFEFEKERFARQKPDEDKVDEYVNEQGQRVIAFRNKKTGTIRQEILGITQSKAPSESSTLRQAKAAGIARARPLVMAARGKDNLADVYLDLRSQYAEAFGDARDFDQVFAPFLSEEDRIKLFSKAGTIKYEEDDNPFKPK